MVVLKRIAAITLLAALAIAATPACSGPKCGSDDLECFLDNMVVVPPDEGASPQGLTTIPDNRIARVAGSSSSSSSGGTTPVPTDAGTECPPGDAFCPGTGCTFTGGDIKNCGGCGKACDSRQICENGSCICAGGNPNCLQGDPPATAPTSKAPAITSPPAPFDFSDPETLEPLDVPFTDPNGCQPAFCARICRGKTCTARSACAPPVKDGRMSGVWRSYLGFLAEPPDTADFTLGLTPISAPGCPIDLLDQMAAGSLVPDIGAEIQIPVSVAGESSSTSTGTSGSSGNSSGNTSGNSSGNTSGSVGGPGTQCSPVAATCNCSLKACSDGTNAWYQTSNGRFDCAGTDCTQAAQRAIGSCCPKQ